MNLQVTFVMRKQDSLQNRGGQGDTAVSALAVKVLVTAVLSLTMC